MLREPVAVGEPGQRVVLGEMPHPIRFMLAIRDVAQGGAKLKAIEAAPGRQAGFEREGLAGLAASGELHQLAVRPLQRRWQGLGNRERTAPFSAAREADAAER